MDLKKIIEHTIQNQTIDWSLHKIHIDTISEEYRKYLTNHTFTQGKVHGYFTLIYNIVKGLPDDAIIVELGNREGMSTLAIYEALKPNQKFYTIDIIKDLRVLPTEFFNDNRIKILYGDCTSDYILKEFEDNSIHFLFSDTVHHYDQVNKEFNVYKNKLKKDSIMLVDDINLNDKIRFYDEWVGEKYSLGPWCHESGFGCFKLN